MGLSGPGSHWNSPDAPRRQQLVIPSLCMALSWCEIPLAVWLVLPEITIYRGLSGIDSALFILLALTVVREQHKQQEWVLLAGVIAVLGGFVAKITYEMITGETVFVDSAGVMTPVPLAHIVGAITGALAWMMPTSLAWTPRQVNFHPPRAQPPHPHPH